MNFNFSLVYISRERYIESKIPFAGYIFNWAGYVVNPILTSYLYSYKKWTYLFISLTLQIILFSQTGLKSFLFVYFLALVLLWINEKYGIKRLFHLTPIGLSFIIILGVISYWTVNDVWISSLFIRRSFYVPALLSFYYYDFFSKFGPTFLSQHRIFRALINYPYHLAPSHLIGEVYFRRPEMGANNGILGDSYMNFGFWGIIIWGFIFILILKILDSFIIEENRKIILGVVAIFANVFVNSALLTSLVTHGLLILLFLSILLPKEVKHEKK
ncbi:MAG: hypothetical protein QXP55_05940 [Nitrososphaerales archaeon]